jgi:hypothetical protein
MARGRTRVLIEGYTGLVADGNFYCEDCGKQVAMGYFHTHSVDLKRLKERLPSLRYEEGGGGGGVLPTAPDRIHQQTYKDVERLRFGCPFGPIAFAEYDVPYAERIMQRAANEIEALRRTIDSYKEEAFERGLND